MTKGENISDEILNAFIDGELDDSERTYILSKLEQDKDLSEKINQLRNLKELVRTARPSIKINTKPDLKFTQRRLFFLPAVAALLAILISSSLLFTETNDSSLLLIADKQIEQIINHHNTKSAIKVVVHLTKNDPVSVNALLDKAEKLVKLQNTLNKPVRVELVANGKGLALFRTDKSIYQSRINKLRQQYDNLLFIACQETMERFHNKNGKKIQLISGIASISSGNNQVALRRQQGWSYLTI